MDIRQYDHERDRTDALRVWREVGWVDQSPGKEKGFDLFVRAGDAWVAELRGRPECIVTTMPGTVRYLEKDLPFCAVTGVATGRIARRRGLAARLTAQAVKQGATAGSCLAILSMFEQGFYERLGFGTGAYQNSVSFDPALLSIPGKPGIPYNLSAEDLGVIHAARLGRLRLHGSCNLLPEAETRADALFRENGFGLGFFDEDTGALTHHFWGRAQGENGPYSILWMAYRTRAQFRELLQVLKTMGDQANLITMLEPPGVQMQDFLTLPVKQRRITRRGPMEAGIQSFAHWQVRMLDLAACVRQTCLAGRAELSFNLELTDPIEQYLEDEDGWRGVAGTYSITLGPESEARRGASSGLSTLRCSVGTFSRLWMGAVSARSLAVSGAIDAPEELIEKLSWTLLLPRPSLDWEF